MFELKDKFFNSTNPYDPVSCAKNNGSLIDQLWNHLTLGNKRLTFKFRDKLWAMIWPQRPLDYGVYLDFKNYITGEK